MAQRNDDLDIAHLFRVIFMQGGQVAIGTAIGAGVVLLVGIVGVLLSPILVPIFLYRYWRQQRRKKATAGQDVSDLVAQPARAGILADAADARSGEGAAPLV